MTRYRFCFWITAVGLGFVVLITRNFDRDGIDHGELMILLGCLATLVAALLVEGAASIVEARETGKTDRERLAWQYGDGNDTAHLPVTTETQMARAPAESNADGRTPPTLGKAEDPGIPSPENGSQRAEDPPRLPADYTLHRTWAPRAEQVRRALERGELPPPHPDDTGPTEQIRLARERGERV